MTIVAIIVGVSLGVALVAFLVACGAVHEAQEATRNVEALEQAIASLQPPQPGERRQPRKASSAVTTH